MRMETRTAWSRRFRSCCVTCMCQFGWFLTAQFYPDSCRQPVDHGQDAVGHAFQLRVNLGQRARRLEDVEVAVERYLVTDLGFLGVDPGVGRMGQHLALEIG